MPPDGRPDDPPSTWEQAWEADRAARRLDARPLLPALWRGARLRCPRCG